MKKTIHYEGWDAHRSLGFHGKSEEEVARKTVNWAKAYKNHTDSSGNPRPLFKLPLRIVKVVTETKVEQVIYL